MRTAMEARLPLDRASILAKPGVMPRTVPSFRTRAMRVSELLKVNLAEAMRFPRASKAAANRACFWPTPRVIVSGVTCISDTLWPWAAPGTDAPRASPARRQAAIHVGRPEPL